MSDETDPFEARLLHEGLSERTAEQYGRIARRLREVLPRDKADAPAAMAQWYVENTRGKSKQTQIQYAAALRKWAAWAGLPEPDLPASRTGRSDRRREDEFRDALSEGDYKRFTGAVARSDMPGHAKAILLLLGETGLRISEVCSLHAADIFQTGRTWGFVVERKGGRRQRVPFNERSQRILKVYWRTTRAPRHGHVFPSPTGGHYTPGAVRVHLRRLREAEGWDQEHGPLSTVSPHVLRHTFATRMLRRGMPIRIIQKILDHSSMRTTSRYATPDVDMLGDAVEKLNT